MLFGKFLYPLLEKRMHVRHCQGVGVGEIDLMLAPAPLPLAALDRHASGRQAVANGAHQRLIAPWQSEMTVDPIIAGGLQITVRTSVSGVVRLIEQIKLQLAGTAAGQAVLL